jgi:hypothetical protein
MGEIVVRIVSDVKFAPLADGEFADFPGAPPPEAAARGPSAPGIGEASERCPLCGEIVAKAMLSAHISECIADC